MQPLTKPRFSKLLGVWEKFYLDKILEKQNSGSLCSQ